ncbi:MAG: molybdenum cofactor biosynthesis protein MoaE [Bryobacteraceae bacterium]|nr:molybdenum cofactor biosynthesis protein MoaE [Bryobacteraceae bacterium]
MLKDITGRSAEELDLEEGSSLGEIFDHYARRFPRLGEYRDSIVLARNQEFSSRRETVSGGDEVALLPPVSGGSGPYLGQVEDEAGHFFALTREPIDTHSLRQRLLRGEDGAIVDFVGVVRNNTKGRATTHLDYECYEPMALKTMAEIGRALAASYPIGRIAMVHRLGRMFVGEASVAVVVTAPHRKPAFEAALEGINRLKRLVPIWKKEHFADGEVWVEGEWDASVLKT